MAAVSSCAKALASFDYRSDHICSRSEVPSAGSAKFTGKSRSTAGRGAAASRHILSSSLILKFPPNFVRQLSTKALSNCRNIGVAQVVAAASGPMNHGASGGAPSGVETGLVNGTGLGEDGFVDGGNGKLGGSSPSEYTSFLNSDGSLAIHAGERLGRGIVTDAITTPIVNTSAYFFKKTADLIDFKEKRRESFEYGRYGNYTSIVAEEKISSLEGAESTILMSSGMCASTVMLMALVPAGGHLVITNDCYRVTRIFIDTVLPKMGITATVIDPADIGSLESALEKNKVALFFTESPTNPFLRCVDIDLVSKLCHAKGALVCIDGTFASPLNQKALALGADIVIHSVTKYIGGHNDVLGGCISGTEKVISTVRTMHHILGGVINPNAAYLIIRGMKTLHLRIQQQNQTAQKMAEILEAHPKIRNVYYPGLASHPEHDLAKKQMKGFGGVVSFEVDGDLFTASKFIDALRIPYNAPSFGGVESIVDQPAIMSYWDLPQSERAEYGIMDNLVRFSFGVEDFDDLRADVLQALETI